MRLILISSCVDIVIFGFISKDLSVIIFKYLQRQFIWLNGKEISFHNQVRNNNWISGFVLNEEDDPFVFSFSEKDRASDTFPFLKKIEIILKGIHK